jgi:hypothetical protein
MKSAPNLAKKDVISVLGCVIFLLMNLGAIGSGGRRRAKEMVCLSNLRQWSTVFQMHTQDNNGYFRFGDPVWMEELRPYYKDLRLLLCSVATQTGEKIGRPRSFQAWSYKGNYVGSYGINGWVDDNVATSIYNMPVFAGMFGVNAWPNESEHPPDLSIPNEKPVEMHIVCVDRHNGAVNHLFMDWSVRKVGLKELWTLKWHRQFDTEGPWTKAGGVQPSDWPEWMRNFKDY